MGAGAPCRTFRCRVWLRDRTTQGKARCLSNIAFAQVHNGGPAHLSGNIATGDYIEEVNRTPILRISDAAAKLKGPTSTLVEVKVRQGGGGDSAYVHLLRQKVDTGDQNNYPIGIAAALRVVQDGVEVDRVIEGGPAWLSGMKEGSVITAIDGAKVTRHFHTNEISDMIRGPEGSRITLELLPPPLSAPHSHGRPKLEFIDLVRMRPVDAGVVSRFREALARQLRQSNIGNDGFRQSNTSPKNALPSSRPGTSSIASTLLAAHTHSPTPATLSLESMWPSTKLGGASSTNGSTAGMLSPTAPSHGTQALGFTVVEESKLQQQRQMSVLLDALDHFERKLALQERSTLRGYEALESHLESVSRTLQSLAAVGSGGVGGGARRERRWGAKGRGVHSAWHCSLGEP